MTGQCSICLSEYVEPVCIPCGHIYCVACIYDVVNRPEEASTIVKCPTCRADFHLVVPDLTYLPKKYHPFVVRPLRRIFIDSAPEDDDTNAPSKKTLERDLAKYKTRASALASSEEKLMQQCERHQAKARAYRDREREARRAKEVVEEQCTALMQKVEEREREVERRGVELGRVGRRNEVLQGRVAELVEQNQALERKYEDLLKVQQQVQLQNKKETVSSKKKQPSVSSAGARRRGSGSNRNLSVIHIEDDEGSPSDIEPIANDPYLQSSIIHRHTNIGVDNAYRDGRGDFLDSDDNDESENEATLIPRTSRRIVRPLPRRRARASTSTKLAPAAAESPVKAPQHKKPRLSATAASAASSSGTLTRVMTRASTRGRHSTGSAMSLAGAM